LKHLSGLLVTGSLQVNPSCAERFWLYPWKDANGPDENPTQADPILAGKPAGELAPEYRK
jgi:hypothetical protein